MRLLVQRAAQRRMLVGVHRLERAEDRQQLVRLRHLNEESQRPVRREKLEGHLRRARPAVRLCHLIAASGKEDPERL